MELNMEVTKLSFNKRYSHSPVNYVNRKSFYGSPYNVHWVQNSFNPRFEAKGSRMRRKERDFLNLNEPLLREFCDRNNFAFESVSRAFGLLDDYKLNENFSSYHVFPGITFFSDTKNGKFARLVDCLDEIRSLEPNLLVFHYFKPQSQLELLSCPDEVPKAFRDLLSKTF